MFQYPLPLEYDMPLFRPPSEANSLILQITTGCSHNQCLFCEMYTSKKFRLKAEDDVLKEIKLMAGHFPATRKVFLADGNAMVLSSAKMLKVLKWLNDYFPDLNRVSSYALLSDLKAKSKAELEEMRALKLSLLYVGIESGDDSVLKMINKSETAESTVTQLNRAREAGMRLSVMILNGLGGKNLSEQHAIASARVVNQIQPEFLSTLVLSFPYGEDHFRKRLQKDFEPLSTRELLRELRLFISETNLEASIFRSDHASNYLALKAVLSKDKEKLLQMIDESLNDSSGQGLRKEWERGL